MIKLGEYQMLTIKHETAEGFLLVDEEGDDILMPKAFATPEMEIEDEVEVFVYTASGGEDIATTETPAMTLGGYAYLKVVQVSKVGAFCDWGVSKQLFLPFRNQETPVVEGASYMVHLFLDHRSERLVGTTILSSFLQQKFDENLRMAQEVDLLVCEETDLGFRVVINQKYVGLVYSNEIKDPLRVGQELKGYIKAPRDDGKIDVSIYPIGHQSIEPNAVRLMRILEARDGFLPYTDKSDPVLIQRDLGISKKLFKKSIGALYKRKLVVLKEDGVHLNQV